MTMAKRGTGLSKVIEAQLSRALPQGRCREGRCDSRRRGGDAAAAPGKAMPLPARRRCSAWRRVQAQPGAYARPARRACSRQLPPGAATAAHPRHRAGTTRPAGFPTAFADSSTSCARPPKRPPRRSACRSQYLLAQAGLETGWGKHQPQGRGQRRQPQPVRHQGRRRRGRATSSRPRPTKWSTARRWPRGRSSAPTIPTKRVRRFRQADRQQPPLRAGARAGGTTRPRTQPRCRRAATRRTRRTPPSWPARSAA